MRRRWSLGAAAIVLIVGSGATRDATYLRDAAVQASRDALTRREHFAGMLTYRTATGATRRVSVTLGQWAINGGTTLRRFPETGALVIQLASGDVTTLIGGERRERRPDEFWTVPAGSAMQVEIGKEQAVLEVLAIRAQ